MLKLVMTVLWSEEHVGSKELVYTFEYSSVEEAKYDLLTAFLEAQQRYEDARAHRIPWYMGIQNFLFAGHTLNHGDLTYNTGAPHYTNEYDEPEILTLEDWFEQKRGKETVVNLNT